MNEEILFHVFNSLKLFYWVLLEMLKVLEELKLKSKGLLKFHASLAYNRVNTIKNNLYEALSYAGISLNKKSSNEELYYEISPLAISVINGLEEIVELIENDLNMKKSLNFSWITFYLKKFSENIDLAIGVLKVFIEILKENESNKVQNIIFALQSIIKDLKIIKEKHYQFMKMFS